MTVRILRCSRGWWYVRQFCPCCPGRVGMGVTLGAAVFAFRFARKALAQVEYATRGLG